MTEMGKKVHEKADIKGDRLNVMLLLLMYSFQGIVNGLTLAMPIIFQNRNVSYAEQVSKYLQPIFIRIYLMYSFE